VDERFHDFYRSRKHYVPDPEEDIKLLMARHKERNIHQYLPNRPATQQEERTHDSWEIGHKKLTEGYLDGLAQDRAQFLAYRSTLELSSHQNHSIEDIINAIKTDSQNATDIGPNTQQRLLERLQQFEGNENGLDEDELAYGYDQQGDLEGDDELRRLRLTDAWKN
jgi:hypothetical protein